MPLREEFENAGGWLRQHPRSQIHINRIASLIFIGLAINLLFTIV